MSVVVMESNRDRDRLHPIRTLSSNSNSNSNTNEQQQLFLCFTSRPSSSSNTMKISKSILSPGRSAREISLSSSLSRRLKTNGSLKGGQSPMFPTNTTTTAATRKKTGAGFENAEPSSPKVTCIGQVRVKSKKKKTHHHHHHNHHNSNNVNGTIRSRSQRRSADYSFRRIDLISAVEDGNNGLKRQSSTSYRNREIELESSQRHGHNNQKWVHIPVTICESLRSLGADFNCFLPCRSSTCLSDKQQQHQREAEKSGSSACGSVLARWLVAVQEGEGGGGKGGRQIELVVGGRDEDEDGEVCGRRSYRKRHVMEDIDIKEIEKGLKERVGGLGSGRDGVVEGGRVSICVPPKNALLLMRCGSDPVKMAALANRFWEPEPPEKEDNEEEEEVEKDIHEDEDVRAYKEREAEPAETTIFVSEGDELVTCDLVVPEAIELPEIKYEDENVCDKFVTEEMYEDATEGRLSVEMEQTVTDQEAEENSMEILGEQHQIVDEEVGEGSGETEMRDIIHEKEGEHSTEHLVTSPLSEREERCDDILIEQSKLDYSMKVDYVEEEERDDDNVIEDNVDVAEKEKKESSALPDCLLLMMCEPKLSMEVSQETWVCTTDFIRWLPPRDQPNKATTTTSTTAVKKNDGGGGGRGGGDELSKRVSFHYKPPIAPVQPHKAQENQQFIPPRSSCSYPAPPAKHEPALYNLTRCKSEPRRAAAKLAAAGQSEVCFWKNRAHAPVGVGAAGMGF